MYINKKTRNRHDLNTKLSLCWASVIDSGPTSNQHYKAYPSKQDTPTQLFGQRRRRWSNIESALGQCIVLTGIAHTVRAMTQRWVNF